MRRWLRRLRVRLGRDGGEILRLHDGLDGQLSMEESAWLYRAARGRGAIVEIGSYRGKSSVILARGSRDARGRVTAIDPHLTFRQDPPVEYGMADHDRLLQAIARHGVAERVTPVVTTSRDARAAWDDGPVDMLWVDGDHHYESVRFDLAAWSGLVRVGGVVAAHDYTHWDDVRRAWDEVIGPDDRFGPTGRVRSIAWCTRVADS